jgi:hypothetical protein
MNMPSKDISAFFEQNTSWVIGQDIFISTQPTKPNNCITLFDTAGGTIEKDLDGVGEWTSVNLQIKVRNTSYEAGWAVMSEIIETLKVINNVQINNVIYRTTIIASPFVLNWDDKGRVNLVLNVELKY